MTNISEAMAFIDDLITMIGVVSSIWILCHYTAKSVS